MSDALLEGTCLHCVLKQVLDDFMQDNPEYGRQMVLDICRLMGDLIAGALVRYPVESPDVMYETVSNLIREFARERMDRIASRTVQ